jgi:hypothetical protein
VDLGRKAAVVLEARRDVGDVELGFDDRLARIARLELGELGRAFAHDPGEREEDAPAILRRRVFPRPGVERLARRADRAIDVVAAPVWHPRDDRLRRGIDYVERRRRRGGNEFAVDVMRVRFHVAQGPSLDSRFGAPSRQLY